MKKSLKVFLLLTAYLHKWLIEKLKKIKLKLFRTSICPNYLGYLDNYAKYVVLSLIILRMGTKINN